MQLSKQGVSVHYGLIASYDTCRSCCEQNIAGVTLFNGGGTHKVQSNLGHKVLSVLQFAVQSKCLQSSSERLGGKTPNPENFPF